MKKKISTAILAAAICLYGCYIGGNNEFAKTYAIENEPIPIPTEIPLPTEQIAEVEPGCYMKIASEPDKVIYRIGDKLDLTGLKLDVMFASGGEMPVSQIDHGWHKVIDSENPLENDNFIVDTSDFDSSKPGEYNITISLTQEAQFNKWWYCQPINIPVTVIDDPIPTEEMVVCVEPGCYIKIASEPDKVIYNIGDKLDLTGLKLDVMYASGGSKPLSQINKDWSIVINSENPLENDSFIVDTSDFDSSKPGEYNITISLTQEAQLKWCYCSSIDIPATVTDNGALIKGDVNADGVFSVADVVMLQKWISGVGDLTCRQNADLNEDGKINVFDCIMLKRKVMENMQSDKIIDYSVSEQQWVRGSSRANTMTEQAYLAKSLNEFKGIIENYELCENGSKCSCGYHDVENCIPEKIDENFFEDKAAVVIYSLRGSSERFIAVDKIEQKQNCLTVYTTTKISSMPTPDMAYQRLILAVDRDTLQDVNKVLYKNTHSVYDRLNESEYK